MLAIIISIIALGLSGYTFYALLFNKKHRAALLFVTNFQKAMQYPVRPLGKYGKLVPVTWIGTAFHLRNDILSEATHCLEDCLLEVKTKSDVLIYAVLKDFKKVSDKTYHLLIEDPFGEVWTHHAFVDRTFIEENLDMVIRIEAEFVSRELEKGIVRFSDKTNKNLLLVPIKVSATGIPKVVVSIDYEALL